MCRFLPYFLQNLRVLKYVGDERKAEWGKHWIEQGFNGKVAAHVLRPVSTLTCWPIPG